MQIVMFIRKLCILSRNKFNFSLKLTKMQIFQRKTVWAKNLSYNSFQWFTYPFVLSSENTLPLVFFFAQRQTARFHLRTGGEFANRAAAHDPESRFPGNFVHAAAVVTRPSDARGARLVPQPDQVPGDVPVGQQWPAAETGELRWAISLGMPRSPCCTVLGAEPIRAPNTTDEYVAIRHGVDVGCVNVFAPDNMNMWLLSLALAKNALAQVCFKIEMIVYSHVIFLWCVCVRVVCSFLTGARISIGEFSSNFPRFFFLVCVVAWFSFTFKCPWNLLPSSGGLCVHVGTSWTTKVP